MNIQEKFEKLLRVAPQPPVPETLFDKLKKDIPVRMVRERRGIVRRYFAKTDGVISRWRVAAVVGIMVLLPLSYGATKLIQRFTSISQLPTITVDFPGSGKLSPDGKHFAGVTWDSELVVIDTLTGQQRNFADGCYGTVVWSADGSEIAVMKRDDSKKQAEFTVVTLKTGDTRTLGKIRGDFEDWSPDGKYLLAVRNRPKAPAYRVVMINLESNERTTLADETGVWPFPGFSPNGEWISYVTKENGRSILNLQEIDGPVHVHYSDFPGEIRQPLWSPDSSYIVFTGTQKGINREYRDLWRLRVYDKGFYGTHLPVVPDVEQMKFYNFSRNGQLAYRTGFELGGIFTLPIDLQTGKSTGAPRQLVRKGGLGSFCWSPDGKQIAVREPDGLSFISADSGEKIRSKLLPDIEGNIGYSGRGMSWSPDGKWIALPGWDEGERPGLFITSVEGSEVRLLVLLKGRTAVNCDPTWSPDSKTIAYGNRYEIYVVNVEEGKPRRITQPSENQMEKSAVRPVFAPDGKSVAYLTGFKEEFGGNILTTTIDGKETRKLFQLQDKKFGINIFDLSPDGRHIVFTPGNKEIWCAPTNGGEPFKIGDISNMGNNAWAWMPKWSPKGDAVTFIVTCEKYQYWVMENFLPAAEAVER
jgi:Tol biopolymer transport system component